MWQWQPHRVACIAVAGESGTGYSIAREASVPQRLSVEKADQPVRVHLRMVNGVVEIVALD